MTAPLLYYQLLRVTQFQSADAGGDVQAGLALNRERLQRHGAVRTADQRIGAKAGGDSDLELDDFMRNQKPEVRAAGEKAAQPWLEAIKQSRS